MKKGRARRHWSGLSVISNPIYPMRPNHLYAIPDSITVNGIKTDIRDLLENDPRVYKNTDYKGLVGGFIATPEVARKYMHILKTHALEMA